jgi:hypothetical protein
MAELPYNSTFVTSFPLLMLRSPQYFPGGLYDVMVIVDGDRKI